jgi:predicted CoA-substrate-specific enzyme activase
VAFAQETRTEIGCHMKGCFFHHPHAATIVDIGGQDSKVIQVDHRGRRLSFKMNRKCAAGTGAFLEEIALRLGLPVSEMDPLARQATRRIRIGAYCTVFSSTEILTLIRKGERVEDIARGVFDSVVQRILEMDPLTGSVILTGGVIEHNRIIAEILGERLGRAVIVPPRPQLTGAFGAALYAREGTQGGTRKETMDDG